jgi:hypothetical protein
MRRITDFKVVLLTDSGETYTVTGERDTITVPDTRFERVFIPLKVSWKDSPDIYPIELHSDPASSSGRERPMGTEMLIYGERDFSSPDADGIETAEFDFREYPTNVFDIFEMQLTDGLWHLDNYTNLESQVRHML